MSRTRQFAPAAGGICAAGFTLIELMVTILVIGLVTAFVIPNLGALVPKARLDAAAKMLVSRVDYLRSEARIQAKRCVLELDLNRACWRCVMPAEERLTTDQDIDSLEPKSEEWRMLQDDVKIAGAGNPVDGLVHDGFFKLVFDENGFTSDQAVVLKLVTDPTMVWTVRIHGLTGQCDVETDFQGHEHMPEEANEAGF